MTQSIFNPKKNGYFYDKHIDVNSIKKKNHNILSNSKAFSKGSQITKIEEGINMYNVLREYKMLDKQNTSIELFFDKFSIDDLKYIVDNINREILR